MLVNWITTTRKSTEHLRTINGNIERKSTDVTCKTHLGYLTAQLPWLVDLASLVCDMNWWLSCRVSALQSVVADSISSGGYYGIHCWWDLIRSKQLFGIPVYRAYVFGGFSGRVNLIYNIGNPCLYWLNHGLLHPLVSPVNIYIYIYIYKSISNKAHTTTLILKLTQMYFPSCDNQVLVGCIPIPAVAVYFNLKS